MNMIGRGYCWTCSCQRFAARSGNFGADYIKERRRAWPQIVECALGGVAQNSGSLRDGTFVGAALAVIGAGHARIEVNLIVSSEHASTNQFASLAHRHGGRLFSPRIRTEMIAAQQHSLTRKSSALCNGVNKIGELRRSLP